MATGYRVEIAGPDAAYRLWATYSYPIMAEDVARRLLTETGCMGNGKPATFSRVIEIPRQSVRWAGCGNSMSRRGQS